MRAYSCCAPCLECRGVWCAHWTKRNATPKQVHQRIRQLPCCFPKAKGGTSELSCAWKSAPHPEPFPVPPWMVDSRCAMAKDVRPSRAASRASVGQRQESRHIKTFMQAEGAFCTIASLCVSNALVAFVQQSGMASGSSGSGSGA